MEGCAHKFMKVVGCFVHGKWFCSEECSKKDPDTQKIEDLYTNGIEFVNQPEGADFDQDDEDVEIDLWDINASSSH